MNHRQNRPQNLLQSRRQKPDQSGAPSRDPSRRPPGHHWKASAVALAALTLLTACGGDDDDNPLVVPEPARPQDARTFTPVVETSFPALTGAADTDRWTGVLGGAAYRVEVPKTGWNGKLVMWAHGYAGTGASLTVGTPIMRRYLIANGYAWAASSYSKNYYDVRVGIEDTNALALAFPSIAAANGRALAVPTKYFISGISMGGQITASAVEAETRATAVHKVDYSGAVPMCGVVGDTELFNYFAGYQVAAQQLANLPITSFPVTNWTALVPAIQSALWTSYPTQSNATGDKLKNIVAYLSGGPRPFYAEGWADPSHQGNIWASLGGDGTITGILNENVLDTTGLIYKVDASSAGITATDTAFNAAAFRITPTANANRLRRDGLRWIPVVNGDISVPVVTLHTLGDLFVPFKMEQVYAARTRAKGTDRFLVQRAIRDVGHCAFTAAEGTAAFDAMVRWEASGVRPAGDDVTTPATLAAPSYGCTYTVNTPSLEDYTAPATRAGYQSHYPACQ